MFSSNCCGCGCVCYRCDFKNQQSAPSDRLFMWTLAEKHSALMVSLEHRYYGESQPVADMSVENLKFLTSEQVRAWVSFLLAMCAFLSAHAILFQHFAYFFRASSSGGFESKCSFCIAPRYTLRFFFSCAFFQLHTRHISFICTFSLRPSRTPPVSLRTSARTTTTTQTLCRRLPWTCLLLPGRPRGSPLGGPIRATWLRGSSSSTRASWSARWALRRRCLRNTTSSNTQRLKRWHEGVKALCTVSQALPPERNYMSNALFLRDVFFISLSLFIRLPAAPSPMALSAAPRPVLKL